FEKGDKIIFKSLTGTNEEYTTDIVSLTETYVRIVLPAALMPGKYRVTAKRGPSSAVIGDTSLDFVFNMDIPDREGMTVKGMVYVGGIGVANVVVSDGFEVTKTDENGTYYLPSAKKHGYVFIS